MTQPDGLFPESAFNFDSLAALAATPQEDWEDQMRGRSTNGFELVRQALFGVLPEDLREGIEFTRALITAIVRQLLNLPGHVWDSAEDALEAITAWIGDLADQVVTFIYNVAGIDLSSWDAFIDSLNDGKGIDLPNLLGPNSPLNAANIFGKLFPRNISGLSLSQLVTVVENELENFISAESVPNVDGWSFDSTVGTPGSAKVVADGTLKTLYGDLIAVSPDQPVDTEIKVQYSGVTSGAGQTIRYVLELFEDSQGLVPASPATRVVGGVTSPSGSSGPVTLGGSPWDPTAGVVSVRPVLIVDSVVTAGSVWWHGPKLEKPLDSLLSGGLGAAIQARINEFQAILDAFKDGVGGVIDDVVDRIQNLVPGSGLFNAAALSNITNIPGGIPQLKITGLTGALSNLNDFIQDVIDAIISAIRGIPFVGGTLADILDDMTGLRETADEASTTATSAQATANATAAQSDTLADYFNTPRTIPAYVGYGSDDVAFQHTLIDGVSTPTLGQIVLVPITVTQDRVYESIKFGIDATTMTTFNIALYALNHSTGDLSKVLDLGDCKSSLNTSFDQQIVTLPTPIGVQAREVYYVGFLQLGGTAAPMHRWSSTNNWVTGQYPRWIGNAVTGTFASFPTTIATADIGSGTKYYASMGDVLAMPAPGTKSFADSFNRANGAVTSGAWTLRSGTAPAIDGNQLKTPTSGTVNGVATYASRVDTISQRAKLRITGSSFNGGGTSCNSGFRLGVRGDGTGRSVLAEIRALSSNAGSEEFSVYIYTVTNYTDAGTFLSGTLRASRTGESSTWLNSRTVEFVASGNTYQILRDGVSVLQWVDSGGAYVVNTNCTELALAAFRGGGSNSQHYILADDWEGNDL